VAVDPRQWFANSAFLKDPFWVRCCSRCIRVTDRQRNLRFQYQSFTVCWWHSAVYLIARRALSFSLSFSLLSDCFQSVHWWFTLNGLNPDKSEDIIIGNGARQRSDGSLEVIDLGNVHIQPSESVRSLGVVIDNTLSFDAHVYSVCKAVYYHAKVRHIRKRVATDVALTIASTLFGARL